MSDPEGILAKQLSRSGRFHLSLFENRAVELNFGDLLCAEFLSF
jgi:hypothetical protein